jgi:hypothetical protein
MKKSIVIILLVFVVGLINAQEKWDFSFDIKANLNQSYYTDNWDGSEKSSVNWIVGGDMKANKQLNDWFKTENSLTMKFGQLYETEENQDGTQAPGWMEPTKSDDEIDLTSLGLFTLHGWVDPFVSLRLETVFEGANLRAFEPALITESFGIAKEFVKQDNMEFKSRLGLSMRQLHQYQKTTTNDGGLESITDFFFVFPNKTTKFTSSFEAYKAFFNSQEDELEENLNPQDDDWEQVDMKWTNELSMQLYKNLSFNVYAEWLYDTQVHWSGRFKQTSGLGFTYKMF